MQIFGALAQLGERYNGIVEVRGSIPLGSTKTLLSDFNQLCLTFDVCLASRWNKPLFWLSDLAFLLQKYD